MASGPQQRHYSMEMCLCYNMVGKSRYKTEHTLQCCDCKKKKSPTALKLDHVLEGPTENKQNVPGGSVWVIGDVFPCVFQVLYNDKLLLLT